MRRFLLPVIFTVLFIMESIFLELTPEKHLMTDRILVPHLLFIGLIFLTIYGNRNLGIIYGFIFGFIFDVVYIEIIGIYLSLFPLLAYVISKLMQMLQTNVLVVSIVTLLGVVLLEVGVYEMNFLIHITTMGFTRFLELRLLPTVILNLIFMIILAYPFKKQFEKIAIQLRNE